METMTERVLPAVDHCPMCWSWSIEANRETLRAPTLDVRCWTCGNEWKEPNPDRAP